MVGGWSVVGRGRWSVGVGGRSGSVVGRGRWSRSGSGVGSQWSLIHFVLTNFCA